MENQHRKINGYRELNQAEIDLMNKIKAKGAELGALITEMRALPSNPDGQFERPTDKATADQRWVSIGQTHLQEGLMALTRAIAQPTLF